MKQTPNIQARIAHLFVALSVLAAVGCEEPDLSSLDYTQIEVVGTQLLGGHPTSELSEHVVRVRLTSWEGRQFAAGTEILLVAHGAEVNGQTGAAAAVVGPDGSAEFVVRCVQPGVAMLVARAGEDGSGVVHEGVQCGLDVGLAAVVSLSQAVVRGRHEFSNIVLTYDDGVGAAGVEVEFEASDPGLLLLDGGPGPVTRTSDANGMVGVFLGGQALGSTELCATVVAPSQFAGEQWCRTVEVHPMETACHVRMARQSRVGGRTTEVDYDVSLVDPPDERAYTVHLSGRFPLRYFRFVAGDVAEFPQAPISAESDAHFAYLADEDDPDARGPSSDYVPEAWLFDGEQYLGACR